MNELAWLLHLHSLFLQVSTSQVANSPWGVYDSRMPNPRGNSAPPHLGPHSQPTFSRLIAVTPLPLGLIGLEAVLHLRSLCMSLFHYKLT